MLQVCPRDTRQKAPQSDAQQNVFAICQLCVRRGQAQQRPLCWSDPLRSAGQSGICPKENAPPCAYATEPPENRAPHH